jgi:hypothetical protein
MLHPTNQQLKVLDPLNLPPVRKEIHTGNKHGEKKGNPDSQ